MVRVAENTNLKDKLSKHRRNPGEMLAREKNGKGREKRESPGQNGSIGKYCHGSHVRLSPM